MYCNLTSVILCFRVFVAKYPEKYLSARKEIPVVSSKETTLKQPAE